MSKEIRKALIGKTIQDLSVRKFSFREVYIHLVTDKGITFVGASDTGVWIGRPQDFERDVVTMTKRYGDG